MSVNHDESGSSHKAQRLPETKTHRQMMNKTFLLWKPTWTMTQTKRNWLFRARRPTGSTGGADGHGVPHGPWIWWGRASPSCCKAWGTWLPSLSLAFQFRTSSDPGCEGLREGRGREGA